MRHACRHRSLMRRRRFDRRAARGAVEHLHGVPARFVEPSRWTSGSRIKPVWQGAVKVFDPEGHPSGAKRAYAWSYRTERARRKFKAVLGVGPVDRPVMVPGPLPVASTACLTFGQSLQYGRMA
jgi:hypothetical protein